MAPVCQAGWLRIWTFEAGTCRCKASCGDLRSDGSDLRSDGSDLRKGSSGSDIDRSTRVIGLGDGSAVMNRERTLGCPRSHPHRINAVWICTESMEVTPRKFSALNDEGIPIPFEYGDLFFRQPCDGSERIVIGPTTDQIRLIRLLASHFTAESFWTLYVLLVSHGENLLGRYESPPIGQAADLATFLDTFGSFFEDDGRHHLWVASTSSPDLLVYDQHNVIFVYGDLDKFESVLLDGGFREQKFWFPTPHAHQYPAVHAETESKLLGHFDWKWSPLQKGDEWE
ncbi:MAG: hypothetical protein ACI841_002588 [Planctomycetota bacterium]|jgi:hypothetical protein